MSSGALPLCRWRGVTGCVVSPPPRFGHAAAVISTADREGEELVVSHGYALGAAADAWGPPSLWHDDVWSLGADACWRHIDVDGERPDVRLGHTLSPAGAGAYLFGGSRGAGRRRDGSAYVAGGLLGDLWRLDVAGKRGEWRRVPTAGAAPASRTLHSCVAVADVGRAPGDFAMVCFGGRAAVSGADSAAVDSSEAWRLDRPAPAGDTSVGAPLPAHAWREWPPQPMTTAARAAGNGPSPRHGHASAYVATVAVSTASRPVMVEHSVFVFGGAGPCAPSAGAAQDAAAADGTAAARATCLLGDTWRLHWVRPGDDFAVDGDGAASPCWQRLRSAHEHAQRPMAAIPRSWSWPRWAAPPGHPTPRVFAAMAATPDGALLLFGGGECAPGCITLGDTWRLDIDLLGAPSLASSWMANGSGGACTAADADDWTLGARWRRLAAGTSAEDSHAGGGAPLPRYRHSLSSSATAARVAVGLARECAVAAARGHRVDVGVSEHDALDVARACYAAASIAGAPRGSVTMFGGETFFPRSAYFGDAFVWGGGGAACGTSGGTAAIDIRAAAGLAVIVVVFAMLRCCPRVRAAAQCWRAAPRSRGQRARYARD